MKKKYNFKKQGMTKNYGSDHRSVSSKALKGSLKWFVIIGYVSYIFLIIVMRFPNVAEQYYNATIPENIESHLSFNSDGLQMHYYVERVNQSIPGKIDIYYYPDSNTLKVQTTNIKNLTVNCRSLYYDECKEIFGFDPDENSNYYKWFFIEKNHLNVNLNSDYTIQSLIFIDVPKPESVFVDSEFWTENKDYEYQTQKGIALSMVPVGSHNIDLYFKSTDKKGPIAVINPSKKLIFVNVSLTLDGSNSNDPNPEGNLINYIWDFGDGNYTSGEKSSIVSHYYSSPGIYGIILTVVNNDYYLGHAYFNITVTTSSDLCVIGNVPNIKIKEDSGTYILDLNIYEPGTVETEMENDKIQYYWYLTDENTNLYSISGENSTNGIIYITPNADQFGDDYVWLWLEDQASHRVCQPIWINITPINDPPTIFGIPDITVHFDVPYEFNYLPYVSDVDTPTHALRLNSSASQYTNVSGLNVTYEFPEKKVDEIEYIILTIWDGISESSDVIAVRITDDWVPNLVKPLPDVFLDEGGIYKSYFDLDEYFMDPDNDTLYYSYGYSHVNVVINTNHTVDFFAPEDWNGEEMTTFRATDPSGALIEDIITVTVIGINDPPIIQNVPNLIVHFGQDYIFDISPYVSDEDNILDDLVLNTSDPEHIKIDPQENLRIILNYPHRAYMPYTIPIVLTISDGLDTDTALLTVYVKDNYPPISIKPFPEIILYEDEPQFNVLNLYDYFKDNDSSLMYFKVINNHFISVYVHVNGSIDISSNANWSGEEILIIHAEDHELAFIENKLSVKVLPVNDPPVISEIPVQRFNRSEKYVLDISPYLFDIDNNITQIEIWLEDCKIDFDIHGTKIIFYTTNAITNTISLHVSDGKSVSTQKILIEVVDHRNVENSWYFEMMILILIIIFMITGILGVVLRNQLGNYNVNELFLIYRNGCLILHLTNNDSERQESDADIISAMFTAVQDFTHDSFANVNGNTYDENWRLKKLEFKNNNILIERGDLLYLAILFTGRPGKKLGKQLMKTRKEIEKTYRSVLEEWSGELEKLDGVNSIINKYKIINQLKSKENDISPVGKPQCNLTRTQTNKKIVKKGN